MLKGTGENMSATCVTPLSDRGRALEARAAAPLARPKAPPPLPKAGERVSTKATSMRVPKGTVAYNDEPEDAQGDDWGQLAAVAKARFADEEREWQEALARAKQTRELDEESEWRRL